ncbi:hypothetical protein PV02_07695 [Methanolobus chelungpuianus]|uniref:Uncharacterized protein n=1 Tax=Methanolobus chelungpuianus TaxID=502115 RepID=A0AAE3HBW9_9EURY|nr:hypothetical protein [Methanolobus chelungpuianus]
MIREPHRTTSIKSQIAYLISIKCIQRAIIIDRMPAVIMKAPMGLDRPCLSFAFSTLKPAINPISFFTRTKYPMSIKNAPMETNITDSATDVFSMVSGMKDKKKSRNRHDAGLISV